METITYVTGNYGKYLSVKRVFETHNINIEYLNIDLPEPNINDIEIISKAKVLEAYKILKKPCFVKDSGFYIDAYPNNPGYPGAFVKRSGISKNIEQLLETMKNVEIRTCKFVDCLTFYDGENFYTFFGINEGTLSKTIKGSELKEAQSKLWEVFIPKNCNKTLAEMSPEERLTRQDDRTSATELFASWYKETYLKQHSKILTTK